MFATIIEIERLSINKVKFFTIKFEEKRNSEFADFYKRMNATPEYDEDLKIIFASIDAIGKRGAKPNKFKPENNANALPTHYPDKLEFNNNDFGLRLYCIRLSDEIVILLNGDLKTKLNPQDCKNVSKYFYNALKIAKVIDRDIVDKTIKLVGREIIRDENYLLNI